MNSGMTGLWKAESNNAPRWPALIRSARDRPEPFSITSSGKLYRREASQRRIAIADFSSVARLLSELLTMRLSALLDMLSISPCAAKVLVAEVPAPRAPAPDVELFASPSARYSCRAAVLLLNLLISRTMSARGGD